MSEDQLGPHLKDRLRAELERVQPLNSPPRYLAAQTRPITLRLAPAMLGVSVVAILALSAFVATGSPNPAVWGHDVVTIIQSSSTTPTPTATPTQKPQPTPTHKDESAEPTEQSETTPDRAAATHMTAGLPTPAIPSVPRGMKRPAVWIVSIVAGVLLVAGAGASAHAISLVKSLGTHASSAIDEASGARTETPEPEETPEASPTAEPTEKPEPAENEPAENENENENDNDDNDADEQEHDGQHQDGGGDHHDGGDD